MKLVHRLGEQVTQKEGEGFFLLTDKQGSFLSLGSSKNITHMQGLFHLDKNWKMYKTIHNFQIGKQVTEIENGFFYAKRRYNNSEEKFTLSGNGLIYEINNFEGEVNLELDFRSMFDYDDSNRNYEIYPENNCLIIHYKKHEHYMIIKGLNEYKIVNQWIKKEFEYDKLRNTQHEFFIFNPITFQVNDNIKLQIAFAHNKEEAFSLCESLSQNEQVVVESLQLRVKNLCRSQNLITNIASHSLDSLRNIIGKGDERIEGTFAGLPWFNQFWSRDELISLNAFIIEEKYEFAKKTLMRYLNLIDEDGRIPNRRPHSLLHSADSIGWLFRRFFDLLSALDKKNLVEQYFSEKELTTIKHKLHFVIEEHMVKFMHDNIIYNNAKETWMDTDFQGDSREGACIEIQTLFLGMFRLMKILCKKLELTYYGYGTLEKLFIKRVKDEFYVDGNLLDRLGDNKIRPNVFLAYYLYPDLLKRMEWIIVFKKIISALWLEWGGFTTLDIKHELFKGAYTGEDNKSYHRGDSWFWINNIAAIVLMDLHYDKFQNFVEKIYHASLDEMLFSGAIGHSSELSSANSKQSQGCFSQAWSTATFIELSSALKKL